MLKRRGIRAEPRVYHMEILDQRSETVSAESNARDHFRFFDLMFDFRRHDRPQSY